MSKYIALSSVEKSFRDNQGNIKKVLEGVSLNISAGSFTILRGRRKSTLLNLIAGLFLPDRGSISVGNIEVNKQSESSRDNFRAENLGYIFQTFNLISALTVTENIYMPSILTGTCHFSDYKEKTAEILKTMEIEEHSAKYPYQLSVGQRQRVAIGRTLFKQPKLILADEPTASLDKNSAKIVVKSLINLKKHGTTLLVATHDPIFDIVSPDIVYNIETKEVNHEK